MISSAKVATPVSSNVPGTPATVSPDSAGTPFDSILALETVAAASTSPQAALDPSTVLEPDGAAELPEGLLADDDGNADDGDDAADDPLAFLAALLAYPVMTPAPATAASAAVSSGGGEMLEGIEDSLASAGKQGGQPAPDAATDPVAGNSPTSADPKALDASL